MDLRRRVIALLERGESAAGVARRLEIHERTVRELRDRHAAGRLEPDKPGPQGPMKLTPDDHDTLRHAVRRKPDATLRELAALLSVVVAESTVHRTLAKLGLSFKKRR
jgi:transposase